MTDGYGGELEFPMLREGTPKVHIFAWRACKDVIPMNSRLWKTGLQVEPGCVCCEQGVEGLAHLLLECTFARQSMRRLRGRLDSKEFALFLMICWSLWWIRNQLVFEALVVSLLEVVKRAKRVLWVDSNSPNIMEPEGSSLEREKG
ncbi:hypothetical protein Salat_1211200 [Sesamum alatum]|uniref:Reverse transcriptase zinc-binding domain-containing protein n=1 Tax=Sesamum alatum TaxID=300844 RepID=A0AAE2CNW3_9LAMI|nr:hypothetical protein Salat_1211200 [Sesamum alatum]